MNRQQRKAQEKRLGITKYRKSLNRKQYFEMLQRNVQEGKKRQEDMKEVRRLQEQEGSDRQDSQQVIQEATRISQEEGIPFIDALNKAKGNLSI